MPLKPILACMLCLALQNCDAALFAGAEKTFHKDVKVGEILAKYGLEDYAQDFTKHKIDYETFLDLTEKDLNEVGVRAVGAKKKILKSIQKELKAAAPLTACPPSNPDSFVPPVPLYGTVDITNKGWGTDTFSSAPMATMMDVNGDGLPDIIFSIDTQLSGATYNSYRCTYLNTGTGWSLIDKGETFKQKDDGPFVEKTLKNAGAEKNKKKGNAHVSKFLRETGLRELSKTTTHETPSPAPSWAGTTWSGPRGMDLGYNAPGGPWWVDIDGDSRSDYCRVVGDSPNEAIECTVSIATPQSSSVEEKAQKKKD